MGKWLVVYVEEDGAEPLYFSSATDKDTPVWSSDGKLVMDDGDIVMSGVQPMHYAREGAETLAFNFITFDKKYMGKVSAVECPLRDCSECGTT